MFTISGTIADLNLESFQDEVRSLIGPGGGWPLVAGIEVHVGDDDDDDMSHLIDPESPPVEGDAFIWYLVEGGIRGVGITFEEEEMSISLPSFSGRMDWAFAARVMCAAVTHGASSIKMEGQAVGLDGLADDRVQALCTRQWQMDVSALMGKSAIQEPVLPVRWYRVPFSKAELALDRDGLEAVLSDRSSRYARAFPASILVSNGIRTSLHPNHIPALIDGSIDGLTILHHQSGAYDDSSERIGPVRLGRVLELLGPRTEKAGPLIYLPVMNLSEEPDLLRALREASGEKVEPRPGSDPADTSSLSRLPALIFLLVAGSDGKVDDKEMRAYAQILHHFSMAEGIPPPVGQIFKSALDQGASAVMELLQPDINQVATFSLLVEKSDELLGANSQAFKQALLTMGVKVATSSGGGPFGIGSPISKDEREILALIADGLGLSSQA